MLNLAGVGKCLKTFQLLRHTPMTALPEFAAHPAVDPIHHHLQDWLNYPHVSSITNKRHVEMFEPQNSIEFLGNKKKIGDTTQNIHPKPSGLLGECFGGLPKPLSQELFVAPRHGVAIKGGADLTLTGSGFVYPAVRAPLKRDRDPMVGGVTLRSDWSLGIGNNLESLKKSSSFWRNVFFWDQTTRCQI